MEELLNKYLDAREKKVKSNEYNNWSRYEIEYLIKLYGEDSIIEKDLFSSQYDRAEYYNKKFGTDFQKIDGFKYANGNISYALNKDYMPVFINKNLEPSVEGINEKDIDDMDEEGRGAYYNILTGKNVFTEVNKFKFADGQLAIALFLNENDTYKIFINKKGEASVKEFNGNVPDDYLGTDAYFGTLYGKDIGYIEKVGDLYHLSKQRIFVNSLGKPDITGLEYNTIEYMKRKSFVNTIRVAHNKSSSEIGINNIEGYDPNTKLYNVVFSNYDGGFMDQTGSFYNKHGVPLLSDVTEQDVLNYIHNKPEFQELSTEMENMRLRDLKGLYVRLEDKQMEVRNNREYDQIEHIKKQIKMVLATNEKFIYY